MRRARIALALILTCATCGEALSEGASVDAAAGFDYCAPPVRPDCVDDSATFQDKKKTAACDAEITRYVSSVFAYRTCMYDRIEKAIRETNATANLMKCREAHQPSCPPAPSD